MSSRNLKLARRILEAIDNREIPAKCSNEHAREVFNDFDFDEVERHFWMLCEHGCFLIKTSWLNADFGWHPLSWKGYDLLEQLKKETQDGT